MSKRALISVFNKEGISSFCRELVALGYEIVSSDGTAKHLEDNGVAVTKVETLTHFPQILGGRVKTLHPAIHGGILAKKTSESHLSDLERNNITPIDLVAIDLYPFVQGLEEKKTEEELIELIDIGGPTMLRAAAKNFENVIVVSSIHQYDDVLKNLRKNSLDRGYRKNLALSVFKLLTRYNSAIADFFEKGESNTELCLSFSDGKELRYGENPHQKASFFLDKKSNGIWNNFSQLQGKQLSFNNIRDVDATWRVVSEFPDEKVCIATKHSTPCGAAIGNSPLDAYLKTLECDEQSIFGGVVGFNREVDALVAEELVKIFLEVIIAPSFTSKAIQILKKKKNLRLLTCTKKYSDQGRFIQVDGGVLLQDNDSSVYNKIDFVTKKRPSNEEQEDLLFGLKIVKHVKSNAIVVVSEKKAIGISGGQVNRFFAAKQALELSKKGSVLVSDGFFPFGDVVPLSVDYGIKAIAQPGGSLRDKDSIEACNEKNISMVFTGERHFLH